MTKKLYPDEFLSIRLKPELKKYIEAEAKKIGIKASSWIRMIIIDHRKKNNKQRSEKL